MSFLAFGLAALHCIASALPRLTLLCNVCVSEPLGLFPCCALGEGAVAAYVMGIAKALLEWMTVPVLALALSLPHGALVYWLSSSTFSILQVDELWYSGQALFGFRQIHGL